MQLNLMSARFQFQKSRRETKQPKYAIGKAYDSANPVGQSEPDGGDDEDDSDSESSRTSMDLSRVIPG
jgi:hypothetical protein